MENSNSLGGARIALLIDFDNVILGIDDPGFDIELVVNALRERGTITVSRVYGDWYRHSRHRRKLMEHGVELVEAPAFGPVIKNSADIKIALDGYEIGMTMPHINTFCLVSGDSDFLPLIKKLQGLGKNVLVICGNRFTSDMLRRNCNEFISYENLLAASYGADEDATTLEGAFALLHRAMAALRERGSEIRTSTLKQMMIQLNPVFSEKTFGYNQFRGFLDKAGREGLIKLGPRDRVSGEFYVLLPEEDEAEVIENIERAEPAEVVENIVEARRGGRNNRRGERGSERNIEETPRPNNGRDNRSETPVSPPAAIEEERRPRSRREARLMALREQEELEQQAPAPRAERNEGKPAAPLATPLTPATDFSPADAEEVREKSMARAELLARGMHVGKVKFSGKMGRVESIESAPPTQRPDVEPDIASTLENVDAEEVKTETAPETENPGTEVAEKSKRSRSRRRKKSTEIGGELTEDAPLEDSAQQSEFSATKDVVAESETSANDESAPENEVAANGESEMPVSSESEAPTDLIVTEEEPAEKKPRRRRTSRKKTEETAIEEPIAEIMAPVSEEKPVEEAPIAEASEEEKPKPRRPRRRTKTEDIPKELEKAILPDGTEQTVSTEALIAASANTPAAQASKPRRRRTARKVTNEAAGVKSTVDENIVTTNETTGEVSQKELAQIPVPVSEDEL